MVAQTPHNCLLIYLLTAVIYDICGIKDVIFEAKGERSVRQRLLCREGCKQKELSLTVSNFSLYFLTVGPMALLCGKWPPWVCLTSLDSITVCFVLFSIYYFLY